MTKIKPGDLVSYEVQFRGPCAPMQPRPTVKNRVTRKVERVYVSGGLAMAAFIGGGSMPLRRLSKAVVSVFLFAYSGTLC